MNKKTKTKKEDFEKETAKHIHIIYSNIDGIYEDVDKFKSEYRKEKEVAKRQRWIYRLIAIFIVLFIYFSFQQLDRNINRVIEEVSKEIQVIEKENQEARDLQIKKENEDKVLNCLSFLETDHKNIKVLDSNNTYSYGQYQFQLSTLKDIFPDLTNEELRQIAMDETQAKEIARKMIFEKGEAWR